jgi:hypothetical protein
MLPTCDPSETLTGGVINSLDSESLIDALKFYVIEKYES